MPTEIEHKYLIKPELWKDVVPGKSVEIKQGYLLTDPGKTIRVRIKESKGYITIKGKNAGISRPEFEYEIPFDDAQELLNKFCSNIIEKIRHLVIYENKTWEVDEFKGANKGLVIAEIELTVEKENFSIPIWVDKNVSDDPKYANSNLSIYPFTKW